MNVIARLEYELAYYDSAVHRFNHYTTRTSPFFLFYFISKPKVPLNNYTFFYHSSKNKFPFGCFLFWSVLFCHDNMQYSLSLFVEYSYYYYSLEFFISAPADGLSLELSDSKFPPVSRTLLSILAIFSNAVVRMVSTRPPTSKSSRPFNNPLVTVPKAPIIIDIIVTGMFHSFFNFLARSRYLSLFSHSFSFILWSAGTTKSTI